MMSETQQSLLKVMTLNQWMTSHGDRLDEVVAAVCEIFDLKDAQRATLFVEEEIENQARLLLIADHETILAVAGWNWVHTDFRETELPVYLGIRRQFEIEGLRLTLLESVMARLRQERINADRAKVTTALLCYHPVDHMMRDLCVHLGYRGERKRKHPFQDRLGSAGVLGACSASLTNEPIDDSPEST